MTEVELSFPHGKGPGSVIKPADLTVVTAAAQNVRVLLIELDTGEVAGGAEHAPAQTGAQCAIVLQNSPSEGCNHGEGPY